MKQPNRLPQGGKINRNKEISFTYNGRKYDAYEGDSLASALLAHNVKQIGRSFKYRRVRGLMSAGVEEANGLIQLEEGHRTIPNILATQIEVYEGMVAKSVNQRPFDPQRLIGKWGKFFPAGFYYKTFMWPKSCWMLYEKYIRKAAGFGTAPIEPDPDHYHSLNQHCDILIIGAGAAGLVSAKMLADAGKDVILVEQSPALGGMLAYQNASIDGQPAQKWIAEITASLEAAPNVKILTRSTAFGYYDHNLVLISERREDHLPLSQRKGLREQCWRVRADKILLATGAIERPLIFEQNDLPGIMLAASAAKYSQQYAVLPGRKIVFFTNNDSAYSTAFSLQQSGAYIAGIVDLRQKVTKKLIEQCDKHAIPLYQNTVIEKAFGKKQIISVQLLDGAGKKQLLKCDALLTSGGWNPALHLSAQSGAKATWDDEIVSFIPGKPVQENHSIGACSGTFDLPSIMNEAAKAAQHLTDNTIPLPFKEVDTFDPVNIDTQIAVKTARSFRRSGKQFVDLQNDVTSADIELAVSEAYQSIEHIKRYTALGFGTDQGKTGNINGMLIAAQILGKKPADIGTTTFRPAYTPISFGSLAGMERGALFEPIRHTPMRMQHDQKGALYEDVGQWKRAWYYPQIGETMQQALNRESLAVHQSAGIMDASTLGKIDIKGPDAAKFLNLIYTNGWLKLGIGRCRYGIMLSEDGMVMDDGVTMRIAEDHFVMTTTTGGAANILIWLEKCLQTDWPELQVYLTSVTDHYAAMAISGPNSRKIVQEICPDVDMSPEAIPFMAFKDTKIDGIPLRILRISFTGELSFELHINANYAASLWQKVMDVGKNYDLTPYGTETMHILRAEKGFIIVGQDTDGTVTPYDLNMGWAIGKKKTDFIGLRSLSKPGLMNENRKQMVGILTAEPHIIIPEGAQLVAQPSQTKMEGHVTSSYYSAVLEKSIALALVDGGLQRMGETIYAALADGRHVKAEITSPVFYDPKGERQNVV